MVEYGVFLDGNPNILWFRAIIYYYPLKMQSRFPKKDGKYFRGRKPDFSGCVKMPRRGAGKDDVMWLEINGKTPLLDIKIFCMM